MSDLKKKIRARFRSEVFERDQFKCRMCTKPDAGQHDAHHITDRTLMPAGGYVKENGITLCPECHELAEAFHRTGTAVLGYSPDDLYKRIGSTPELAKKKSEKLAEKNMV